jgi:23S rRNA (adenine2030-N6)-methyltransferase
MNYRHAYHAGNFADVMKHLALTMILDHLKKKETPFCVIDAHGGTGLYDLNGEEAQKTKEWEQGIGRLSDVMCEGSQDLALYGNLVRPYLERNFYPGSPLLIAQSLRSTDRLVANELHPKDFVALKETLNSFRMAHVTHLDAYECIRAHIPPLEKRGLILIDPPFEKTDEFDTLSRQMTEWKRRFATGIFMIWYPIKAHSEVHKLKEAAYALSLPRTWCYETLLHPRTQENTFNGSGLIVFNTPYKIPERLEALNPRLKAQLGLYEVLTEWLTPA